MSLVPAARAALDDAEILRAGDPRHMLDAIASLGTQLRDGFVAGRSTPALPSAEGVRAVVVCGMGGSGISGDVVRAAFRDHLPVPVVVVKGYALPAFCDGDTLVFASSFSGNTEETVAAYTQAVARGCRVVAAASGGELAALAEGDDVPFVPIPDVVSMPRAAIGWLAAAPIGVLAAVGLLLGVDEEIHSAAATLDGLADGLGPDRPAESNDAKALARWIGDRLPVIWGTEGVGEAAALRWKTQFNENAKVPAFCSVLPELDHNDVEGWHEGSGGRFAVIVLRHSGEPARTEARVRATIDALGGSGLDVRDVHAPTGPPLAALFGLIALGDFTSTYAALARGIDPSPVPVLTALKRRLLEDRET